MMWDLDGFVRTIVSEGAVPKEIEALHQLHTLGGKIGHIAFQSSKAPSFVIHIPTRGMEVHLLTARARKVRFYWGHFVGGYDSEAEPDLTLSKFEGAYELAGYFSESLKTLLAKPFPVFNMSGGFREPNVSLAAISEKDEEFFSLLREVCERAL